MPILPLLLNIFLKLGFLASKKVEKDAYASLNSVLSYLTVEVPQEIEMSEEEELVQKGFRVKKSTAEILDDHKLYEMSSQTELLETAVEEFVKRRKNLEFETLEKTSEKLVKSLKRLEKFTGDLAYVRRPSLDQIEDTFSKIENYLKKVEQDLEGDSDLLREMDRKLVGKDQTLKKKTRLIRAYRRELDRLASVFEVKEILMNREEAVKILSEMRKYFGDLQSTVAYNKRVKGLTVDQLEKMLEKIVRDITSIMIYVRDFEDFREEYLKHILKTRKKLPVYET